MELPISSDRLRQEALQTIAAAAHRFSSLVASRTSFKNTTKFVTRDAEHVTHRPFPQPQSLIPSLVELGLDFVTAQSMSAVFSHRAQLLKKDFEAKLATTYSALSQIPLPPDAVDCSDKLWHDVCRRYTETVATMTSSALTIAKKHVDQRYNKVSSQSNGAAIALPNGISRSRGSSFNYASLPFLEHAFDLKHTPSHGDKVWLAQTTGMTFQQINAWFQNRRRRTKEKYGSLAAKPETEKVSLEAMVSRMRAFPLPTIQTVNGFDSDQSEYETVYDSDSDDNPSSKGDAVTENAVLDLHATEDSCHAFPAPLSYPPDAGFQSLNTRFRLHTPPWRRHPAVPDACPLVDISDLVAGARDLSVREEIRAQRLKKRPIHPLNKPRRLVPPTPKPDCSAARAAITTVPCRAPLPSLVRKDCDSSPKRTLLSDADSSNINNQLGRNVCPPPKRAHISARGVSPAMPAPSGSRSFSSSYAPPPTSRPISYSSASVYSWAGPPGPNCPPISAEAPTLLAPAQTRKTAPLPKRHSTSSPTYRSGLSASVTKSPSQYLLPSNDTTPRRLARLPSRAGYKIPLPSEPRSRVSSSGSDVMSSRTFSSPSSGADSLPGTPSPTLLPSHLPRVPSSASSWDVASSSAAFPDLFIDQYSTYSTSLDRMRILASATTATTQEVAMEKPSSLDSVFPPMELMFAV